MLTRSQTKLLTAAIDGELSAEQKLLVRRLLQQSKEAQQVFQQLRRQAQLLRNIAPICAPPDLHTSILAKIGADQDTTTVTPLVQHYQERLLRRRHRFRSLALAASILGILGSSLFVYWASTSDQPGSDAPIATTRDGFAPDPGQSDSQGPLLAEDQPTESSDELPPDVAPVLPAEQLAGDSVPERLPMPGEREAPLTTKPFEGKPWRLSPLEFPLILTLDQLRQDQHQSTLRSRIRSLDALRIDLFVNDPLSALRRLKRVAKKQQHGVYVDQHVSEHLKNNQPIPLMLFANDLKREELIKLLVQVAWVDHSIAKKESGTAVFDQLVLMVWQKQDDRQLASLLGLPVKGMDQGRFLRPLGTPQDPLRNLPEQTANELARSLRHGSSSKAHSGNSPEELPPRLLAIPYSLSHWDPRRSAQVREFLSRNLVPVRGDTFPIMIVIKPHG